MRELSSNVAWLGLFALVLVLALAIGSPAQAQDTCLGGRTSPALVAGVWRMVSLPCDPLTPTVAGVWGDEFGVENYDNPGVPDADPTWAVWEWHEDTDTYVHLALDAALGDSAGGDAQAQGYWILHTGGGTWTVEGNETEPNQSGTPCRGGSVCYEVALTPPASGSSMHLLSNPIPFAVPWSLVRFTDRGLRGPALEIFSMIVNTFYTWNGAAYQSFTEGDSIPAFAGFWLEVLPLANWDPVVPTINFPAVAPAVPDVGLQPGSGATQQRRPDLATGEWEVRLVASAPVEGLEDPGNLLGQLAGAMNGYDPKDLKALDPFTTPYLDLVFPHEDWGDRAAEYNRDYHARSGVKMDSWQFIVKSDDPDRDVVLSWDGDRLMDRMWLRDDLTGELVRAKRKGELQTYTFNMEGEIERSFSWALAPNL